MLATAFCGASLFAQRNPSSEYDDVPIPIIPDVENFALNIAIGVELAFFAPEATLAVDTVVGDAVANIENYGTAAAAHFFGFAIYAMPLYVINDWLAIGGEVAIAIPAAGFNLSVARLPIRAAVSFDIDNTIQITPLIGTTLLIDDPQFDTTALFDISARFDFLRAFSLRIGYLIGDASALIASVNIMLELF